MKINILGVQVDSITQIQALAKVNEFLNSGVQHHIITANPEIVLMAWQKHNFRELLNHTSLVTADGIGLIWAGKFLKLKTSAKGRKNYFTSIVQAVISGLSLIVNPNYCRDVFPERLAGVDLMEKMFELASQKNPPGWKVYLVGGEEGIAKKTAEVLKKKYLNLNVVGAEAGPCLEIRNSKLKIRNNGQNTDIKFQNLIDDINKKQPDILFVAFGAPKQEYWINENLSSCPSVKVAIGVGGAFDFISGKTKRAPQIYRDLGLEWLHRLFNQPWRAVRIFNATIRFVYNVIKFKHLANR